MTENHSGHKVYITGVDNTFNSVELLVKLCFHCVGCDMNFSNDNVRIIDMYNSKLLDKLYSRETFLYNEDKIIGGELRHKCDERGYDRRTLWM